MPTKPGIQLPANLLQELGLQNESGGSRRNFSSDRKANRKAARVEKRKKPAKSDSKIMRRIAHGSQSASSHKENIPKQVEPSRLPVTRPAQDEDTDRGAKPHRAQLRSTNVIEDDAKPQKPGVSKKLRERLAEDDAEIAALERRLGLKGNKKLPKSFDEDGLGELLGDLEDSDVVSLRKTSHRSREEEDWLNAKRRKALTSNAAPSSKMDDNMMASEDSSSNEDFDMSLGESESDMNSEELQGFEMSMTESDDDSILDDSQDFEDFDDEKATTKATRVRENPYIAPQSSGALKYIPPSLRKADTGNVEEHERLRRQIQGTLNRLSEAKILAITTDMEKIYRENARQHVSSILLDALFALICDPAPLQDTFMILHAGFVTALYKTIGTEFGAQVIQRFVEAYDHISNNDASTIGRRLSNMVTFLAELYNFHVIGSPIIYDMIRGLTTNLNEENAELLLRIARSSGNQLRHDDSASLKDIVTLLHAAVEKQGAENLSVRAKFMIETIENLKNNKVKTGVAASNIRIEHTASMKKMLGSMNKATIKAREPLRISLQDIRNSDKRGKWWLVGASFNDTKESKSKSDEIVKKDPKRIPIEDRDIDLNDLAREQGMNTEIRRAIFISLVSSSDDKEACMRLKRLGMKSKQKFEIPKVVVHCVGAEKKHYNRFYTKIAKKLCVERDMRKAFQFTVWEVFKRFEDDEDEDEERLQGGLDMTAIVFMAKMYGELVADGLQSITLLKHMELAHADAKSKTFAEVFLITIFQQLGAKSENIENKIRDLFSAVAEEPEMVASLRLFLRKTVRSTKLVQDSEQMALVKTCCKAAEGLLLELMSA